MKVSISLPADDVAFVDSYAERTGATSRSSVFHRAIGLLRTSELEDAYADAFREWEAGEDARLWDTTIADGLGDAPR